MKRIPWFIAMLWLINVSISACTSNQSGEAAMESASQPTFSAPDDFRQQLNRVVQTYLLTKDALVASNTEQTTTQASQLLTRLQSTPETVANLSEEAQQKWAEYRKNLLRSAETLQATQILEEQRVYFEDVSETLYSAVNDFGTSETLYKQYCPMAFDDKGAFWLSAQEEIRNPYFGSAMLKCGTVEEVLSYTK